MKRLAGLFFVFMVGVNLYGQSDSAFIYTYGGIQNEVCNQIKPTYDKGYIMIGTTNSFGCGNTGMYAIKIDSSGNHKWSESYGGSGNQEGFSVAPTFDHGYAFVGLTDSYGYGGYDVFLVKTDSIGKVLWQKTYGGPDWDFGYSIQQLPDSGFIICGQTYSYGAGNGDVYIVRTNKHGDTLWTKAIGGTGYDGGNSICVENDSLYAIVGNTTSFGKGDTDVYFIMIDDKGRIKKDTTYGSTYNDVGNSIRKTLDHGYIIFGSTDSISHHIPNEMLIKTDSIGHLKWMHIFASTDSLPGIGHDAIQDTDGSYLAVSTSSAYGNGACAMRVWQFNSAGFPLSGPSYGGAGYQVGNSVAIGRNGNIVFAGATNSPGYTVGLFDAYMVRLKKDSVFNFANYYIFPYHQYKDTAFCTLGIVSQAAIIPEVKIFPNPVVSSATLLVQGEVGVHYFFSLQNVLGQFVIRATPLQSISHGKFVGHIEKGNLVAGVYIYNIIDSIGVSIATGKIIVE